MHIVFSHFYKTMPEVWYMCVCICSQIILLRARHLHSHPLSLIVFTPSPALLFPTTLIFWLTVCYFSAFCWSPLIRTCKLYEMRNLCVCLFVVTHSFHPQQLVWYLARNCCLINICRVSEWMKGVNESIWKWRKIWKRSGEVEGTKGESYRKKGKAKLH